MKKIIFSLVVLIGLLSYASHAKALNAPSTSFYKSCNGNNNNSMSISWARGYGADQTRIGRWDPNKIICQSGYSWRGQCIMPQYGTYVFGQISTSASGSYTYNNLSNAEKFIACSDDLDYSWPLGLGDVVATQCTNDYYMNCPSSPPPSYNPPVSPPPSSPSGPGGFTLNNVRSSCYNTNQQLNYVYWDLSSGATSYDVYKLVNGQNSYEANVEAIPRNWDYNIKQYVYYDIVDQNTNYGYYVVAKNSSGSRTANGAVGIYTYAPPVFCAVPDSFSIISGQSSCSGKTSVFNNISWSSARYASGYRVYRNGSWIATTGSNYYQEYANHNNNYTYQIEAYNNNGSISRLTTLPTRCCIPAPSAFNISGDFSRCSSFTSQVNNISWPSSVNASYQLFRNNSLIQNLSSTTAQDTVSTSGTNQYRVLASNACGSTYSNNILPIGPTPNTCLPSFSQSSFTASQCNYENETKTIVLNWALNLKYLTQASSILGYQVFKDGASITNTIYPQKQSGSYTFENVPMENSSNYRVRMFYNGGFLDSNPINDNAKCAKNFNVSIIANEIDLNTGASLTVGPDNQVSNYPPPGFNDLYAPNWQEIAP